MKHKILKGFVVIEGLDGSGTTTQLGLLSQKFRKANINVFPTNEPTDYPFGKLIRSVLKKEINAEPGTLARLFAADRYEHIYNKHNGIIRNIDNGVCVICDRYLFSSLAYQSLECGFNEVFELNKDFPLPEHLFFIDTPIEVCQRRIGARTEREIFEFAEMQDSILKNYQKSFDVFKDSQMKFHKIDGSENEKNICLNLWNKLFPAEK